MTTYRIHTVQLHNDGSSAVNVPALTSHQMELNPELIAEVTSGKISPDHIAFSAITPDFRFNTYNISTVLDEIGVRGLSVDSDTNQGVTAYLQKHDDYGVPSSGSVHRSLRLRKCLVIPTAIECQHQGDATLECQVVILQKSGSDPVILSDVAALPSVTVTPTRFTLGDIDVAGNTLTKFRSMRLEFGNDVEVSGTQSLIYPQHVEQKTQSTAQLTITGIDPTWYSSSNTPLEGVATTHANTTFYLRKRVQSGSHFVTSATLEHIEFTMAGMAAITTSVSGGTATRPTEHTMIVRGSEDSSGNVPIIIDTTAAHPT